MLKSKSSTIELFTQIGYNRGVAVSFLAAKPDKEFIFMEELGFLALLAVIFFIFVLTPATFITSIMINFSRGPKIAKGAALLNIVWGLMSLLFTAFYYNNMEGKVDWQFIGPILGLTIMAFVTALVNLFKGQTIAARVLNGVFAILAVVVILALVFFFKVF